MEYELSDVGIVCALGRGKAEVKRRLLAHDTSGMKLLKDALTNNDETYFGFAPLTEEEFSKAEYRVDAIVDAAMSELKPTLDAAIADFGADRIGVVIGTSNSTMEEFIDNPDRIDMFHPAQRICDHWGVKGPALAVSTACSSSAKAFASARRLLDAGECDAVLVGGADAFTRTVCEGFHALESLSPGLCRPLSPDRDGINLGEGAAIFLMRRPSALHIMSPVRLLGVGESSDAYHLTSPDPEGKGAEAAMRSALSNAGIEPSDIDFINLHGTATIYNDAMECAAVSRVFSDGIEKFSTKNLTGHCLGAAGAIEAALCWLMLIDADSPRYCISNSFAFGGSNAALVLGVPELPIPQRPPMVMIKNGAEISDNEAEALADTSASCIFFDPALDGVPACAALEYMAQTMAFSIGMSRRRQKLPPQVGFVLGARHLEVNIPFFKRDEKYRIYSKCEYHDMEFGSFICEITDSAGVVVASGVIKACLEN